MKRFICLAAVAAFSMSVMSFADEAADPVEPYQADGGNLYLSAIEYWGECGYAGGSGVSFGYRTNDVPTNRACAVQAHTELKAIMDSEPAEVRTLSELDGPTSIYLIMSDCTNTASPLPARMWHYAAQQDGTGGLTKFHAVTRRAADGSVVCQTPNRADFLRYVNARIAQIRASQPQR